MDQIPVVGFRRDLWLRAYKIEDYRELIWSDVSYEDPKTGKSLLSASGKVCPGHIVSIWGPVDSGVDLLARILAGSISRVS